MTMTKKSRKILTIMMKMMIMNKRRMLCIINEKKQKGITSLLRYRKTWDNTVMILNCKKLFSEVVNWYEEQTKYIEYQQKEP